MKKIWAFFLLLLIQCTQPAPIMQITYSLDLPGSVGVSSTLNFSDFSSSGSGAITTLTFTNDDGDILQFTISGIHVGTFDITGSNTMTGTFGVLDPGGTSQQISVENTGDGFININSLTGSGSNITGMSGDFQVNIQNVTTDPNPGTGSMTGVIGF